MVPHSVVKWPPLHMLPYRGVYKGTTRGETFKQDPDTSDSPAARVTATTSLGAPQCFHTASYIPRPLSTESPIMF